MTLAILFAVTLLIGWFPAPASPGSIEDRLLAVVVDRHEVDGVGRPEEMGPMTGHPASWTVLHEPPPTEREVELDGGRRQRQGVHAHDGTQPRFPPGRALVGDSPDITLRPTPNYGKYR